MFGHPIALPLDLVKLRALFRGWFDVRPGEHLRTWAMFFYLLFVLFAYYIVKPVSRAMFLTTFNIDKLPQLYILIAIFGGILAYLYSRLATRSSLRAAVFAAMSLSVASLVVMWWLIRLHLPWMLYVLNIWVSLFSIVTVSQGWLVASNLFDTREAKRLYPLLGMGMVVGAAFGGEFTNRTAVLVGTPNLLLASAFMVLLAYLAFLVAAGQGGESLGRARAAAEESGFSFSEMVSDIVRVRHLQVIIGMMLMMYLVDTLVEYQFQAMARTVYRGDQLAAFFGQFYGIYLNGVEFVFQLFLTVLVVRWLGVGGALQISPVAVALTSIATIAAPGVASAGAVRLTEASTRYTLNKTGMELLYMPLPLSLRNRIKAFIDICIDRLSRGIGGVLLLVLTTTSLHLGVRGIAVVASGLCLGWTLLAHLARREYVTTIRRRLSARRLDFASARVRVHDAETIRLLETTAQGGNPRQAAYALGLLGEAHGYDVRPLLKRLAASPAPEVRESVYEAAAGAAFRGMFEQARGEISAARSGRSPAGPATAAVRYLISLAPDRAALARELLDDPRAFLVKGALEALRPSRSLAERLITADWLDRMAHSSGPDRRRLAIQAMGELRKPEHVPALIDALGDVKLRRPATAALAAYGPAVCGTLSAILRDGSQPRQLRLRIPRVLARIPHQQCAHELLETLRGPDLWLRAEALKGLNRLRETAPGLKFDEELVTAQILDEARRYFELNAALAPFKEYRNGQRRASRLLARTIEERLTHTLERLFRLLGLRYPPKEIYGAYLAVSRRHGGDSAAALEFLDNVLDRNLKRILLPLLDAPENLLEHGKALFGVEPRTAEEAIRELIRNEDSEGNSWLAVCAMAAAAELRLRSLAGEIARAAADKPRDVSDVARWVEAELAV